MEKKKWKEKRVATIYIEPYLSEYIYAKYKKDNATNGLKIPYNSDLYFCIWENMAKAPKDITDKGRGNLKIHLPCRRSGENTPWKDPAYFNHLSKTAAKHIENQIRRMFNFELHRVLLENEEFGRPLRNLDVIYKFIREYKLKSISSDALMKNYYRYRNRLRQKRIRPYNKS